MDELLFFSQNPIPLFQERRRFRPLPESLRLFLGGFHNFRCLALSFLLGRLHRRLCVPPCGGEDFLRLVLGVLLNLF